MTIDAGVLSRRIKPEKWLKQLGPRSVADLRLAKDESGRIAFVPDTTIYIGDAGNNLTAAAQRMVDAGPMFHCVVCISELTTGLGNLHPKSPRWRQTRTYYHGLIDAIPSHRLLTPDAEVWAEAGLIAGTLTRIQGLKPHQRKEALNDALIFLTAAKQGLPVLTNNRNDFDLIQQVAGRGDFIVA